MIAHHPKQFFFSQKIGLILLVSIIIVEQTFSIMKFVKNHLWSLESDRMNDSLVVYVGNNKFNNIYNKSIA